jgi:hypothetical protein
VFDYRDKECAAKIKAATNDKLLLVFDTIAIDSSAKICANAMSSSGDGKYCHLQPVEFPRPNTSCIFPLGYTVLGDAFVFDGETWEARPDDFAFWVSFVRFIEKLLEQGDFKPRKPSIQDGGLNGILAGLEELRAGKVSGSKLVYRTGDN